MSGKEFEAMAERMREAVERAEEEDRFRARHDMREDAQYGDAALSALRRRILGDRAASPRRPLLAAMLFRRRPTVGLGII